MMPDVFFGQIHRDIVKRFQNKRFRDAPRERRFRAIQFLILKMTFEDSSPVIPSASDNAAQSNENTGNAKRKGQKGQTVTTRRRNKSAYIHRL